MLFVSCACMCAPAPIGKDQYCIVNNIIKVKSMGFSFVSSVRVDNCEMVKWAECGAIRHLFGFPALYI